MMLTDGYVDIIGRVMAPQTDMVYIALFDGPVPTLDQFRDKGYIDRLYYDKTEPSLRTIAAALGGGFITGVHYIGGATAFGKGNLKFPFTSGNQVQLGLIHKDATPTWAALLWGNTGITFWAQPGASYTAAPLTGLAILSVGDENSSHPIKIKGGKMSKGGLFTPTDVTISYVGNNVIV